MDELGAAWQQLQVTRAYLAGAEELFYGTLPQFRTPKQQRAIERYRANVHAAMERYRLLMAEPDEVPEADAYATCDWGDANGCNGSEVFLAAVLVDVEGCKVCPKCIAADEERREALAEMPRSYEDEVGP